MLHFPEQEDIRLKRAPLTEVICQVRFPPILRIASERPAAFQEKVRAKLPQLEEEHGLAVLPIADNAMPSVQVQQAPPVYQFKAVDGNTTLTLAPDFYALSTTAYQHWADFWAMITLANSAVQDVYEPNYAVRIGLRYINEITFANTGLQEESRLRSLLRSDLLTFYNQGPWEQPLEMLNRLLLAGEQKRDRLTIRVGVKKGEGEEPVILLDFDYFQEGNIPFETLEAFCQRAHDTIYKAFRWALTDDGVFEPVPDEEM
ncbi:MAG: TIGR04255 family protein [Chloroflexi bacterium]|jgi:uncharacterized protein (TIGR04255 family)|nr:TIGR04255 family protein [Chloroflexota bacterium]